MIMGTSNALVRRKSLSKDNTVLDWYNGIWVHRKNNLPRLSFSLPTPMPSDSELAFGVVELDVLAEITEPLSIFDRSDECDLMEALDANELCLRLLDRKSRHSRIRDKENASR